MSERIKKFGNFCKKYDLQGDGMEEKIVLRWMIARQGWLIYFKYNLIYSPTFDPNSLITLTATELPNCFIA